jgi:predicted NACHT family NTPase
MLTYNFLVQVANGYGLSPQQKEVFLLKFGENKPNEEISKQLGIKRDAYLKRMGEVYKKFQINGQNRGKEQQLRGWLIAKSQQQFQLEPDIPISVPTRTIQPRQLISPQIQLNIAVPESGLQKLAQQMRAWFDTLGYHFERYQLQEENYFEWVINVPEMRGYRRILVRGIEEEAQISDVVALKQNVNQQKTDKGWLISLRRISQEAQTEVKKQENKERLLYYTFDELLDKDADFSCYFNWLENEVKLRCIDQTYVPVAFTPEEFDPIKQQRIASNYNEQNSWLDGYIDLWLDDPAKEQISILGEFSTGKTCFAFHYAWTALQRYQDAQRRGGERPRLPLIIQLRDFAKVISVESLFSEFFFRKHEIPLPGYSAFEQLNRMGKLLLILDGFDEMAARVDKQQRINNFWELTKLVVPGAKVILTCR